MMEQFVKYDSPKLVKIWDRDYQKHHYFFPLIVKLAIGYLRETEQKCKLNIPSHLTILFANFIATPHFMVIERIIDARSVANQMAESYRIIQEQYLNIIQENEHYTYKLLK